MEAERARFLEEESEAGNRVGFDSLGQNQRVFEAFSLILSRRPTVSDSLEERFVKAHLQWSLQPSLKTISIAEIRMLTHASDYFSSISFLLYNVGTKIRKFIIDLKSQRVKKKIFFKNSKGNRLCGIISDPTGDRYPPILVLCHGFSTSKGGRTYVRLEEIFSLRNYSTFRFDFFGHGESEGKFEDITVSEAVDDVKCAIRFVKDWGYRKIGLIGSSFGGLASIITAGQPEDISVLALKSPVSDYMGLLIARDQDLDIKKWKEEGTIVVKGVDGRSLRLNYSFFEDAQRMDGYQFAKSIKVPTLLVHGDCDQTVPLDQSRKAASLIPDCRLEIIEGADHTYSDPQHFERMLELISCFIFGTST